MRVLLVDDQRLVREVLGQFLSHKLGADVREAATVPDALQQLAIMPFNDLILVSLPTTLSEDLLELQKVIDIAIGSTVALITENITAPLAAAALAIGSRGVILKTLRADALLNAIQLMTSGEVFIPAKLAASVDLEGPGASDQSVRKSLGELTPREFETLQFVAIGLTNREIGEKMGISEATVKLHLYRVFEKCGARNRADAVRLFYDTEHSAVPPGSPGESF